MYYKITNKESKVYQKLHKLRTRELEIEKENEIAVAEKIISEVIVRRMNETGNLPPILNKLVLCDGSLVVGRCEEDKRYSLLSQQFTHIILTRNLI